MIEQNIASVDFSKVAALQQKRTLAFVNHFVITTVQFLNNFSKTCEQKLMHFERKLEKVEAAMVLLEARLSSIPEVNSIQETYKSQEVTLKAEDVTDTSTNDDKITDEVHQESNTEEIKKPETKAIPLRPEYERFVKMVQVGVPLQAVKLKVSIEGLDPNILEQILNK